MDQNLSKGTILQGDTYRYEIVRTLGQGSFGITYLATTQIAGSLGAISVKVAIKEFFMKEINMREGSSVTGGSSSKDGLFDKYRQKFRREAQNLSNMQHPGIVKVIELFDANGTSYIVMEFLGGGSFDDYILRRGKLPENEALQFTRRIGESISFMHSHHMLHLDLKPSNIMLNDQNEPVVIDFGLSKQYGDDGAPESSTSVGGGTPGYSPIEQASYHEGKDFPVTIDVYALGATLFKMLTGHRPPESDVIMNEGFPYSELKGVSQSTVAVLAKAMAFRKADRYQSVREFLVALGSPSGVDESTSIVADDATDILATKKLQQETFGEKQTQRTTQKMPQSPVQRVTARPPQNNNSKLVIIIIAIVLALAAVVAGVVLMKGNGGNGLKFSDFDDEQPYQKEPVSEPVVEPGSVSVAEETNEFTLDRDRVKRILVNYLDANIRNDFDALYYMYADHVERFIGHYNISKDSVISDHRMNDGIFKILEKRHHVRLETFTCFMNGDRIEATIEEDYDFDTYRDINNTFLLEKHFVLNKDYKIVSVWEKQLSHYKDPANRYYQ